MVYQKTEWKDHVVDQSTGKLIQQGTPVSAKNLNKIEQGIEDAHKILEQSSRQAQALKTGVQIVNGDVTVPVSIQMEGRTLVPMQNNRLEALKYYVLAATNFKVKHQNGDQIAGVGKFQGRGERPSLIRVANFEGKVAGSTLENPHSVGRSTTNQNLTALVNPDTVMSEPTYSNIAALDGVTDFSATLGNGYIAQHRFSFNLIEEIERKLGRIPRTTLADKVQWCKENINYLAVRWYGYGNSPVGNKSYLKLWQPSASNYYGTGTTHTNGAVTVLTGSVQKDTGTLRVSDIIDPNGLITALAHADASDNIAPSTIYTDYVSLEIELTQSALLLDPQVPLYEVTKEEYDNILVTWTVDEVIRRYPATTGVQHIQNPYIMAEGENLLPPLTEWVASGVNAINNEFISPYEVILNASGNGTYTLTYEFDVVPGQKYTFKVEQENRGTNIGVVIRNVDSTVTVDNFEVWQIPSVGRTFTIPSGIKRIYLRLFNTTPLAGVSAVIKNPILCIGDKLKSFKMRNPSYLFAEVKLGSIGGMSDLLYEVDGKYWVRKAIEKDLLLDGSLDWGMTAVDNGYKIFRLPKYANFSDTLLSTLIKYNGFVLKAEPGSLQGSTSDLYRQSKSDSYFYVSVSNTDTGFADVYSPVNTEIKAYFNGWKVKTADPTTNKPTAWVSIVDGTDAPTQTLAYVSTNRAAGYTPYKLSYVIDTPRVEEARVEGAISIDGPTQIEVGSGVIAREKANFVINGQGTSYNINSNSIAGTALKNRVARFLKLYKGNIETNDYFLVRDQFAIGYERMGIEKDKFDKTVEYYVSYLVWDKQLFTTNPVETEVQFTNNIRTAIEETAKQTEDNSRNITVQANILYDVLKRLKAGGL